jgi:hypothetical protein
MKVSVVTVSNRLPTEPYYHFSAMMHSWRRFGVEPTVLGMDEPWYGLVTKPRLLRKWLMDGKCDADCLIFVDAWDSVAIVHPDEIANDWSTYGRPWICGSEKALFPAGDESKWPACASSYRFLNSGAIIATPEDMLKSLDAMAPDDLPNDHEREDGSQFHSNDQEYFQQLFLKQPIPMRLDTECRFIWNLCDVDISEYEFSGEKVRNKETGTWPMIVHANGSSKQSPGFLRILQTLRL